MGFCLLLFIQLYTAYTNKNKLIVLISLNELEVIQL